jgi:DNA-binding MarR family transcriptional regulator
MLRRQATTLTGMGTPAPAEGVGATEGAAAATTAAAVSTSPEGAPTAAEGPTAAGAGPAGSAEVQPLTAPEEAAWRAIARAIVVLPRVLEADLLASHGLNLVEYMVLMNLSEQPGHTLRMNELANVTAISASGLTRVIDRLERQRLVERIRARGDGRGQLAALTDTGLERLMQAYPSHLRSVRKHVIDHLEGLDLVAFATAMGNVAAGEPGPPLRPRRAARR